jgi:amino acid transporter
LVVLVEAVIIVSLPKANIENLVPFVPNGYDAIYTAAILCFYSVIGWENVDAMAGEVKDPGSNYRKGIKYAIAVIAVFYLSIVITTVLVLDVNNIDTSSSIITLLLSAAFDDWVSKFATIFSIVLILLGLNAWVLGSSRLLFALSRDKVIPKFFSNLDSRSVPKNAIILQCAMCLTVSFMIMIFKLNIDYILELASLAYLLLYTLIFFCGILSFTTKRLKALSLIAMTITVFFIIESNSEIMSVVMSLLLCCFIYVFFIVGKRVNVQVT